MQNKTIDNIIDLKRKKLQDSSGKTDDSGTESPNQKKSTADSEEKKLPIIE